MLTTHVSSIDSCNLLTYLQLRTLVSFIALSFSYSCKS